VFRGPKLPTTRSKLIVGAIVVVNRDIMPTDAPIRALIVTPKKIERGSGVDQKFDFLNRYSDGRSETVDAKISSKCDRFTIHMLHSEVGWITYE
jgi:hypothetical protein